MILLAGARIVDRSGGAYGTLEDSKVESSASNDLTFSGRSVNGCCCKAEA